MTHSVAHQVTAGLAWRGAKGDKQAAVRTFINLLEAAGLDLPPGPSSYVALWGPRMLADGSVAGRASKSGRKRKLTNEQVAACHEEASRWFEHGAPGPYGSATQFCTTNAVGQRVIADAGCEPATLFREMKKMYPGFGYKQVAVKDILTPNHKSERVAACEGMRGLTAPELHRVVWLDAKSMILVVAKRRAWVDAFVRDYEERMRPPQQGSQIINLKYYIAVSPLLGPFWLRFITGTTGMPWNRPGKSYRVRLRRQTERARRPPARALLPASAFPPIAHGVALGTGSHLRTATRQKIRQLALPRPAACLAPA